MSIQHTTKAALQIVLTGCILVCPPLYGGGGDGPELSFVDMNHLRVDLIPLSSTNVEIGEDVLFEVKVRNNYDTDMQADLWFTVDLTGVDHEKRVSTPYLDRQSPISGTILGNEEIVLRFRVRPLENTNRGPYTFYAKVGFNSINFIKSWDRFRGVILDRDIPNEGPSDVLDEWVISSAWAVNEAGQKFLAGQAGSSQKTVDMIRNYPNPFNPSTNLLYEVKPVDDLGAPVTLDIYDVRGRYVRTLVDGYHFAGIYTVRWDGKDEQGRKAGPGIYLFKIQSGRSISFKKGVLTE